MNRSSLSTYQIMKSEHIWKSQQQKLIAVAGINKQSRCSTLIITSTLHNVIISHKATQLYDNNSCSQEVCGLGVWGMQGTYTQLLLIIQRIVKQKEQKSWFEEKKTEEQYSSTPGDTMKEIKYFPGRIQQTHWIPTRISPACFPHKYSQTCINMDQRGIQHRYCLLLQLLFSNHYTSRKITIKLMWPISNLEIHVQDLEVSDCDLVMICRHTVSDNFINI